MPYSHVCPYCNKPFNSPEKTRKYCCRECSSAARQEHSSWHVCEQCGKEFYDQKHKDRKYCSPECVQKAQSLGTEERQCPICGKQFVTTLRKPKRTCSIECANAAKANGSRNRTTYRGGIRENVKKIKVSCAFCGIEFEIYPRRVNPNGNFCCRKHHYEFAKVERVTRICEQCGKEYQVLQSYVDLRGSHFCSKECQAIAASERMRQEGNSNWKGGTSVNDYGPNWCWQRKNARKRDKYTCQICGATKYTTRFIDVHHVVPFKTFNGDYKRANTLSNLICLCRPCHAKVENKIIDCPVPQSRVTIR